MVEENSWIQYKKWGKEEQSRIKPICPDYDK